MFEYGFRPRPWKWVGKLNGIAGSVLSSDQPKTQK